MLGIDAAAAAAAAAAPQLTTQPVVTTSSVLALTYGEGVMMAADTLASYGRMCRFKDTPRYMAFENEALVASSGEYSDHQFLQRAVGSIVERDSLHGDGCHLTGRNIASLISRMLYMRRNKFNPLWLSVIVAGKPRSDDSIRIPLQQPNASQDATSPLTTRGGENGRPFLAYVDLQGTFYEEEVVATGMGRYSAITLMREKHRPDMPENEARALLEECMRILFYRDCSASNKVQFARITNAGISVEQPQTLSSNWSFEAYTAKTIDRGLAACSW